MHNLLLIVGFYFLAHFLGFYSNLAGVLGLYTLFQGDFNLVIQTKESLNVTNGSVLIVRLFNEFREIITWKQVQWIQHLTNVNVSFDCGIITDAGIYTYELVDGNKVLDFDQFEVRWPSLAIQIPSEMYNYRSMFSVKFQRPNLKCHPTPSHNMMIHSTKEIHLWQSNDTEVLFQCNVLSHPGYYRVVVRSGRNSSFGIISISDTIHVTVNDQFQLQVPVKHLLPCEKEIQVFYNHPQCTGNRDRIRLYGKKYSNVSVLIAKPFKLHYITEKFLVPSRNVLTFPCHLFHQNSYDAACFRYVNMAPNNAVIDISETCIPIHNTTSVKEPQWGAWSNYSDCTSRCGTGIKYRYRYCDNPPPQFAGSFCLGNPIQSEQCLVSQCPNISSPLSRFLDNSTFAREDGEIIRNCKCGCVVQLGLERTFTVIASTVLCPRDYLRWTFQTEEPNVIQLKFVYLRLNCHANTWLYVRDGVSENSQLIAILGNNGSLPENATSSLSSLSLVLNTSFIDTENSTLECITGFIAHLRSIPNKVLIHRHIFNLRGSLNTSIVIIISILLAVLCGVALLTALYSNCGIGLKRYTVDSQQEETCSSIHSDENSHPLLSLTSVTTVSDEDIIRVVDKRRSLFHGKLKSYRNRLIPSHQKSLPSISFALRKPVPRTNPYVLRRSLTSSPRSLRKFGHSDSNTNQLISKAGSDESFCYSSTINANTSDKAENIELVAMKTESEITLKYDKEEKVLNTKVRVVAPKPKNDDSMATTASISTVSISDQDQDLEMDYYDWDARNAGDVPDSFLRILPDNVGYWDADLTVSLEDVNKNPKITELSTARDIPFADDDN